METRIAIILLALFALAESSTGADGEYSPEVLFEYNPTSPAPDYLVFESYLGNVNATDKQYGKSDAVHFIQDTLAIDHNENGTITEHHDSTRQGKFLVDPLYGQVDV